MMEPAILSVANLRKSYGNGTARSVVVDDLSFTLRRGECYGLLGPNGAGKTTTLRLCLGLTVPDSGDIVLVGKRIPAEARSARLRVGVVPQGDNLDPDFTVTENLLVFGRYFGMPDVEIKVRIPRLLEFASLTTKKDARIGELSGGMKRRLTLARALVNDPDLIFMDEPTTGLDPQARHMIWDRLKTLLSEGKTIVLTTHFMDEAERLCDRLAVIDHGRMIAEGSPRNLIAQKLVVDLQPCVLDPELVVLSTKLLVFGLELLDPDVCPISPFHQARHELPQRLQRQRIGMLGHGQAALRHAGSES